MKIILSFAFALFLSFTVFGQQKSGKQAPPLINKNAVVSKFHTLDELNKMGKADLTKLYKERFKILIYLLPYTALSNKAGATFSDIGIPETKENVDLLEKEYKNTEGFYNSVSESLDNLVPYADKENIIWSILFYEEIIKKSALGKDY